VRASHLFNTMEARGAISVTERAAYIGRIRGLARKVMELYIKTRTPKEPANV
jgi:glycyl-tRNA synthetase alpha chain